MINIIEEEKFMFCEKCGAKLDDESLFCEKCGTKVGEGACADTLHFQFNGTGSVDNYNNVHNYDAGRNKGISAEIGTLMSTFLKDPAAAIKMCCKNDYSLQGAIYLGGKCLIIALIFALFKNLIAGSVNGFYWIYNISAPSTFIIILFMLLVGDVCWIGLFIGVCKIIDKQYNPKLMVGVVGLVQVYIPVVIVMGLILTAIFGNHGANIAYIAGIAASAILQYEGVAESVDERSKSKGLYGTLIAGCIYGIIWVCMLSLAGNMYGAYYWWN